MFSGGRERVNWERMGFKSTAKATDQAFSYIQNTSLSSASEIIISSLTEREHTQM